GSRVNRGRAATPPPSLVATGRPVAGGQIIGPIDSREPDLVTVLSRCRPRRSRPRPRTGRSPPTARRDPPTARGLRAEVSRQLRAEGSLQEGRRLPMARGPTGRRRPGRSRTLAPSPSAAGRAGDDGALRTAPVRTMEWVETTGRSVEEAKEAALDRLGVGEDDAEFELLAEPKSGLFGR